jgi:gamma-glutamyl:cysteine ligase YbdK (ATP-grasp superfamily)
MGFDIDRAEFSDADHERFSTRLRECVEALRDVLERPGFGDGATTIGAELELNIVDAACRPLLLNRRVLRETTDPRLTHEVDRFNLEINSRPVPLAGRPFRALERELGSALAEAARAAAKHGGTLATVGVLPTLREEDLTPAALTEGHRYRALSAGLRRLRREPFRVCIEGRERVELEADDVTLEGANTSFQLHLRVAPSAFVRTYNAAQIATGVALSVGGNSPTFLGRHLWEETRIALFRQAVDVRRESDGEDEYRPARVTFGHGWLRASPLELFAESVAMHAPLLPSVSPEDPLDAVRNGRVPKLHELRLHHGTVWRWNRAVYDDACGGHLRIEFRALPAGPTRIDELASAAFLLGLTLGLAPHAERLVHMMTFGHARRNFYQAAKHGLDAELLWPTDAAPSPHPTPARALVDRLLPIAHDGLVGGGVEHDEATRLLRVIEARAASGQTGAAWQRATLDRESARAASRDEAAAAMLQSYATLSAAEAPVHTWPLDRVGSSAA